MTKPMRTLKKRLLLIFVVFSLISASVSGVAQAAVATAPQTLTATPGNASAVLAWAAPASNGGNNITDYTIEWSNDGGTTWHTVIRTASTALTATVTGLTNGKTTQFRVSAVNSSGTGPASSTVTTIPFVIHTANDSALFSACPTGVIPAAGFTDITSTDVDCIKYYSITQGTTATTYSPYDNVSRWQMALFLTRLVSRSGATLPSGTAQGFVDISGYSSEIKTAVNQLKQLGITVGKTATTYAPADNVTREEMALFISRLLKKITPGPGANLEYVSGTTGPKEIKSKITFTNFTDIATPSMMMESRNAIANLWNLGVTDVQTATLYEPSIPMTRKMMATFMARALDHSNARPAGLVLQASSYRVPNASSAKISATIRSNDLTPSAGSYVDTFYYNWSNLTNAVRFDTAGICSGFIGATIVGSVKCTIDTGDPKTDIYGNIAQFDLSVPNNNKVDVWAWTTLPPTSYDNDIHGAGVKKITIESYGGA